MAVSNVIEVISTTLKVIIQWNETCNAKKAPLNHLLCAASVPID